MSNPRIYVSERFCYGSTESEVRYHTDSDCYRTENTTIESRYKSWLYRHFETQTKCKACKRRDEKNRTEKEKEREIEEIKRLLKINQ